MNNLKNLFIKEKRLVLYSAILAVPFAGFFVVGQVLQKNQYLSCFGMKDILLFLAGVAIMTIGIMGVLKSLSRFSDKNKIRSDSSIFTQFLMQHTFLISFIIIMICYIPPYFAAFPGVFSYDAPHQVWQFVTGNIKNNQPVVSSAIIYHTMLIGKKIFGNWEGAVGIYVVLQMIFAAVTFSYILKLLYRKTNSKVIYGIALAFFALHPMNHLFVVNCAKDVAYAYFTVWVILFFGEGLREQGKYFQKNEICIFLTIALFLFLFYRNNSIYALILFVPVALIYYKYARKRLLVIFAVTIGVYYLVTGPIYSYYDLASGNKLNEMLAIPSQQIVNTYIKYGDELTKEEKDIIVSVFPTEEISVYMLMYKPENSDMIRPLLKSNRISEMGLGHFIKIWVQLGIKHPISYIEAALNNTRGYWYLFHEISGENSDRYIEYTNSQYEVGIHTERYPILKGLAEKYYKIGEEYSLGKIKGLSWLFSMASTLYLYLLLICFTCYRKDYKVLIALFIPMALYLTVFAGPLALLRYIYPMTLSLPYLWGIALE